MLDPRNMLTIEDAVLNLIASSDVVFYLESEMKANKDVDTDEVRTLLEIIKNLHVILKSQIRVAYIDAIADSFDDITKELIKGSNQLKGQYSYLSSYRRSEVEQIRNKISKNQNMVSSLFKRLYRAKKQNSPDKCDFINEFGVLCSTVGSFREKQIDDFFAALNQIITDYESSKVDKQYRADPSDDLLNLKTRLNYFLEYDFQKINLPNTIKGTADALESKLSELSNLKNTLPILLSHRSLREIIDNEKKVNENILTTSQITDIANIIQHYYTIRPYESCPPRINHAIQYLYCIKPSTVFCFSKLVFAISRNRFYFGNLINDYIINNDPIRVFEALSQCVFAQDTIKKILNTAKMKKQQSGEDDRVKEINYYMTCFEFYFQRTMRIIMPIQAIVGYLEKLNPENSMVSECLLSLDGPIRLQKQITQNLNGRQKFLDYIKEIKELIDTEESFMSMFFFRLNKGVLTKLYEKLILLPNFKDETNYIKVCKEITDIVNENRFDVNVNSKKADVVLIKKMLKDYQARAMEQQVAIDVENQARKTPEPI